MVRVSTDLRRARGEASRQALLDATLRILERSGPQGVTHRAVAREAGISAQAVGYHFGSIDEVFVSAIQAATGHWPELMRQANTGSTARDLATVLIGEAESSRARLIAEVELYLHAARRPALRAAATAWTDAVAELFGDLDEVAHRGLIAAMDGLCLQLLIAEEPLSIDVVTAIVERALCAPSGGAGESQPDP
jgi:DNA-binding transcriptional regulator YbjK